MGKVGNEDFVHTFTQSSYVHRGEDSIDDIVSENGTELSRASEAEWMHQGLLVWSAYT